MKVLDLFCGAGGLAHGFSRIGSEITGVDNSEIAGKTFELNIKGEFLEANLSKEFIKDGGYDIIIGGPPCKPWSAVNVTRRGRKHADYHLLSKFFEHIEYHSPKIFILENVPPITHTPILQKHVKKLIKRGFSIAGKTVRYSDYGAPTGRHRLILVGVANGDGETFFGRLSKYRKPPTTVEHAIWELRNKEKGWIRDHTWPELRTINKYKKYYETKKFGWYILKWNEPAPSFGNVLKTYILHPDSFNDKPARVISPKEGLLIMGFDKSFHFPRDAGLGARYQMIADSVSPVFSYAVARVAKKMLERGEA
jgi:DNA (cytosine-5)-methyltransferase 1